MLIDLALPVGGTVDCRPAAVAAEAAGFHGTWVSEIAHDPFVACTLAATATRQVGVGTAVAVAFARSPMSTAVLAHDLQSASGGRFRLGLGTQVRAHVTRRFAMPWSAPVPRMREYVAALRAIWAAWAAGSRLDFRGRHYEFTLMPVDFVPQPREVPAPPVLLSGVGPRATRLAGEVADGFLAHAFSTERYRNDVTLPALAAGLSGRAARFETVGTQLVATGSTDDELTDAVAVARRTVGFYASTPAYRPVLEADGRGGLGDRLHALSQAGRWDDLAAEVDDDLLHDVAVVAPPGAVAVETTRRFPGFDRVSLYLPHPPTSATIAAVGAGIPPQET